MEDHLRDFEWKYQIGHRWKPDDQEFADARYSYFKEKQEVLHGSMKAAVVKR